MRNDSPGRGRRVYGCRYRCLCSRKRTVENLLRVLDKLVNSGNTVIIIEHNMDVIKTADHIIDLGPEGGDGGGRVLAEGPPEKVAKIKASYTGKYLKEYL